MSESNVAVLIDYENVGLDSIEYLLDQLSDVGRLIIKRAYADWSVQRHKRDQLLELGIEAMHHFRSTKSGKNSSDISLAIDAIDLLYNAPVDAFVIVSSDSDFVPLVSKLRSAGKIAIGAGRREGSSPTLVKSCDRYIFLDDATPTKPKRVKPRSRQAESESLVVRATEASMDDQGQVVGSKLYQTMVRIDPSFNFKALGHRNFTQFLSSSKEVLVTRTKDVSDVIVTLNHSHEAEPDGVPEVVSSNWDRDIDAAWTRRQRNKISGQAAAADAAKILGVPRLSASKYPSLDKLLAVSDFLRTAWRREKNTIIKKP